MQKNLKASRFLSVDPARRDGRNFRGTRSPPVENSHSACSPRRRPVTRFSPLRATRPDSSWIINVARNRFGLALMHCRFEFLSREFPFAGGCFQNFARNIAVWERQAYDFVRSLQIRGGYGSIRRTAKSIHVPKTGRPWCPLSNSPSYCDFHRSSYRS